MFWMVNRPGATPASMSHFFFGIYR
jgi:hypothetical protein